MSASLNRVKYKPRQIAPRPITVDGDVAYVPLTQGYVATIDVGDVHLVSEWRWYAYVAKSTVYAIRFTRRDEFGRQFPVRMHRVIAEPPDGFHVDHIDHNGLNNRRINLRIATSNQNSKNRRKSSRNTSGFKGVSFDKATGRWRSRIWLNGRNVNLGCHSTPEAAHKAYCSAAVKAHGEFACF